MSASEELEVSNRVDAAIGYTGLVLRALCYAFLAAIADHCDCGRAILTGILAGDILSRFLTILWAWRDQWLTAVSELILLGIVLLFVRSWLTWPEDQAMRAIAGLAALGVFSAQAGGSMLTRIGPG